MSLLGLKLVSMPVPEWNRDVKQTYPMQAQYLTIHNTANDASALAEISYMNGNSNYTSYHWAVDDIQAIQAIPHNFAAWHCGDGAYGTGNRASIGIEICHSLTPGNPRYAKSEDNGAKLAAIILYQMGWGIDRIRKHQDWSGKYCPHRILDNGAWDRFKQRVNVYLNMLLSNKTENIKVGSGGDIMEFTFQIKDDPKHDQNTVYYVNSGTGTYMGLHHPHELRIIREMYKECTGRDMPHKVWSAKAPWHTRLIQGMRLKKVE